jgi:hypothetical protein
MLGGMSGLYAGFAARQAWPLPSRLRHLAQITRASAPGQPLDFTKGALHFGEADLSRRGSRSLTELVCATASAIGERMTPCGKLRGLLLLIVVGCRPGGPAPPRQPAVFVELSERLATSFGPLRCDTTRTPNNAGRSVLTLTCGSEAPTGAFHYITRQGRLDQVYRSWVSADLAAAEAAWQTAAGVLRGLDADQLDCDGALAPHGPMERIAPGLSEGEASRFFCFDLAPSGANGRWCCKRMTSRPDRCVVGQGLRPNARVQRTGRRGTELCAGDSLLERVVERKFVRAPT